MDTEELRLDGASKIFFTSLNALTELYDYSHLGVAYKFEELAKVTRPLLGVNHISRARYYRALKRVRELGIEIPRGKLNESRIKGFRAYILDRLPEVKNVRKVVTDQVLVSLVTIVNEFVNRVLIKILNDDSDRLKSDKRSFTDPEVVEGLFNNNLRWLLVKKKVDELSFSSLETRIKELQKQLEYKFTIEKDLLELVLIRNAIVHNRKLVSKELCSFAERYKLGKPLRIKEEDYARFLSSSKKQVETIRRYYTRKFPTRTTNPYPYYKRGRKPGGERP